MKLKNLNLTLLFIICIMIGYACSKKVENHAVDLKLEQTNLVLMELGSSTVNILSGNGGYRLSTSPTGIVTAKAVGDKEISISAITKGRATIKVTDAKQKTITIDVEVKQQSDPLTYSQFGAKGDGVTDDFDALIMTHNYANEKNMSVKADQGAKYYLSGKSRTIVIMTDTDFGDAEFIVDDTNVEDRKTRVFSVRSKYQKTALTGLGSLTKNQQNIGATFPGNAIVTLMNSTVKHYIRKGENANSGTNQQEVILVDKDGNVDESTPIIWDYSTVTSANYRRIDENTLTIKGGKFTTIANGAAPEYPSYSRVFEIQRSNVVVDGMVHYVTGEGSQGAPYDGWINISECANITIKNTLLTGHKMYRKGGTSDGVAMGTYDLSMGKAINVTMQNVKQTNAIDAPGIWGIMGSNFCKNLVYDNCELSRFDAHQGVYNATIKNSIIGREVNLIGHGTFLLENSTLRTAGIQGISLRSDYGSTWDGEFIIRNSTVVANGAASFSIIKGNNDGSHDFGYDCSMPRKITIENLTIDDSKHPNPNGVAILGNFNPNRTNASYTEAYPYMVTQEVIYSDIKTTSGKPWRRSDNDFMFKDVIWTGN